MTSIIGSIGFNIREAAVFCTFHGESARSSPLKYCTVALFFIYVGPIVGFLLWLCEYKDFGGKVNSNINVRAQIESIYNSYSLKMYS